MTPTTWIGTVLVRADAMANNDSFYGVTADSMRTNPRMRGGVAQLRRPGQVEERPGRPLAPVRPSGKPVLKDVSAGELVLLPGDE